MLTVAQIRANSYKKVNVEIMDPIQLFLKHFRQALSMVDNDYYRFIQSNNNLISKAIGTRKDKKAKIIAANIDRHAERVFCYELYYQIRYLMDQQRIKFSETFPQLKLQSELKKELIYDIVEDDIKALDKEYIPDFLLHTPGNFKNQLLIIEVKSKPDLSFSGMKGDLLKIQQFINNYQYKKGIFLTINTNPKKIETSLKHNNNKSWLQKNINTRDKIIIMYKESNDIGIFEQSIEEILN